MIVFKYSSIAVLALLLASCGQATKETQNSTQVAIENVTTQNPEIKTLTDIALSGHHGYNITRSLTTEIGARPAGSANEAKARKWAEAKFSELGFKNIKTEIFTVEGWERGLESAQIISPSTQNLFVTALGGSVATPKGGIQAPVVYFKDFESLKTAPEGGLDGKIVYISGKMKRARDGAGYGIANMKRRNGASEASKRGALAVLIRSVGTDSHRFPHTGQMRYAPDLKKIPIGAISAPDADQLDRIFTSGKDVVIKLELGAHSTGDKISGNVMGEIVGTDHPEDIILIGAHLDSWDLGTGAIDDGAGVGIVMGAAQVLMQSGLKPKRTIRVVLFGSEEIGLKGGFAYAKAHKFTDLDRHVLATESDFGAGKIYGLQTGKGEVNQAAIRAFASEFKFLGIDLIEGESTGGPDIIPLDAEGVPTIRLNQDGIDYFDLHHTPDDTFDKIDPDDMAQNVAAYASLIWLASESSSKFKDK
ncbi:MAG: M20/M25/M40 family metallo-hydrolase [Robiginitomaculum sp.]|nr:M20/M25/M40 family metallo-hydrolase [Robiginitomaculum sp.]